MQFKAEFGIESETQFMRLNEDDTRKVLDEIDHFKKVWLIKQAAFKEIEFENIAAVKKEKNMQKIDHLGKAKKGYYVIEMKQ